MREGGTHGLEDADDDSRPLALHSAAHHRADPGEEDVQKEAEDAHVLGHRGHRLGPEIKSIRNDAPGRSRQKAARRTVLWALIQAIRHTAASLTSPTPPMMRLLCYAYHRLHCCLGRHKPPNPQMCLPQPRGKASIHKARGLPDRAAVRGLPVEGGMRCFRRPSSLPRSWERASKRGVQGGCEREDYLMSSTTSLNNLDTCSFWCHFHASDSPGEG